MTDSVSDTKEWYLACLLFELRANRLQRKKFCKVSALVHADSPDAACDIAPQVGQEIARSGDFAPKHNRIFRGMRDLNVVYDDLEHGEEIIYEEHEDMPRDELQNLVCAKEKLAVFSPTKH
ncbi:MAG: DUF4288 domain-containing protein [Anaerolineae bacterium]|nr:DUF4288 domain-containing protein [Anaerolineae bacterium]